MANNTREVIGRIRGWQQRVHHLAGRLEDLEWESYEVPGEEQAQVIHSRLCALREFLEMHFEQELALVTDLCQLAGGHHPELNASLEMIKRNQQHITRNLGKTLSVWSEAPTHDESHYQLAVLLHSWEQHSEHVQRAIRLKFPTFPSYQKSVWRYGART